MSELMTLELTQQQRDLVLEGLRYIRSSRRYEFREPLNPQNEQRDADLRVIADLMGQLDSTPATPVRARS